MTGNEILRTMSHWVKSRARSLKIIWEGAVKGSEKDKCPTQEGAGRGQRTRPLHQPDPTSFPLSVPPAALVTDPYRGSMWVGEQVEVALARRLTGRGST